MRTDIPAPPIFAARLPTARTWKGTTHINGDPPDRGGPIREYYASLVESNRLPCQKGLMWVG
jgi:hypothetical protein